MLSYRGDVHVWCGHTFPITGNLLVTGVFHQRWPVMWSFDGFLLLSLINIWTNSPTAGASALIRCYSNVKRKVVYFMTTLTCIVKFIWVTFCRLLPFWKGNWLCVCRIREECFRSEPSCCLSFLRCCWCTLGQPVYTSCPSPIYMVKQNCPNIDKIIIIGVDYFNQCIH